MDRTEFQTRLNKICANYQLAMMLIGEMVFPASVGSDDRFRRLQELRDGAEQKYINESLSLQRDFGIQTPVALGRTE